jgi:hypothetical protein
MAAYAGQTEGVFVSKTLVRRFTGTESANPKIEIASEARKRLGVAYPTLIDLVKRHPSLIAGAVVGAVTFLHRSGVDDLVERKRGHVTKAGASKKLRVSLEVLNDLISDGIVTELTSEQWVSPRLTMSSSQLDGLVRSVSTGVPLLSAIEAVGLLELRQASYRQIRVSHILKAVLEGRLLPRGWLGSRFGLGGVLFDESETKAAAPSDLATLSLESAAAELGVTRQSSMAWADAGILRVEKGRVIRKVLPDAIEEFRRTYVTATELASRMGLHSVHALRLRLEAQGLQPVRLSPEPKWRVSVLYKRASAEAALGM